MGNKSIRCFVSILFFVCYPLIANCQSQKAISVEELKRKLSTTSSDLEKATVFNSLSDAYLRNNQKDSALSYAQKAKTLSKQLQNKKIEAVALFNLGNVEQSNSNLSLAIEFYRQAIVISNSLNYFEISIKCYLQIGDLYIQLSKNPEALQQYQKALDLSIKTDEKLLEAYANSRIGRFYNLLQDSKNALLYLNTALEMFKVLKENKSVADVLANIGNVYMSLDVNKSLSYYEQSSKIYKLYHDKESMAMVYANVAFIYQMSGNYLMAIKYHNASNDLYKKMGDSGSSMLYLKDVGNLIQVAPDSILQKIGIQPNQRFQTAVNYELQALALAEAYKNPNQKQAVLSFLIPAYEQLKDYQSAYRYGRTYITLRDSLNGQNIKDEVLRKEMRYALDTKEAINKSKQEQKGKQQQIIRNILMIGVGAFFLFSWLVYTQRNKLKKEKQINEKLLLNILPKAIVDELKLNGKAEPQQFNDVSVLFADFDKYSEEMRTLNPHQIVNELNECFSAFDAIIEKNGLEKIKTIGTTYLAVCGLPTSNPNHAQKTIQAAFDILDFMEKRKKNESVFDIQIGINSGSLIAGIIGIKKFAYDIWGDTVNTAARMAQNSIRGKINISESTYQKAQEAFSFFPRGAITAKGKGEVKMYFVNKKKIEIVS